MPLDVFFRNEKVTFWDLQGVERLRAEKQTQHDKDQYHNGIASVFKLNRPSCFFRRFSSGPVICPSAISMSIPFRVPPVFYSHASPFEVQSTNWRSHSGVSYLGRPAEFPRRQGAGWCSADQSPAFLPELFPQHRNRLRVMLPGPRISM